jgi:hypothetical protein
VYNGTIIRSYEYWKNVEGSGRDTSCGAPWVLGYFLNCVIYALYNGTTIRSYEYWKNVEGSGRDLCYDTILEYVSRKWGKLQETLEGLAGRRIITQTRHLGNTKHKTCPLDCGIRADGFDVQVA